MKQEMYDLLTEYHEWCDKERKRLTTKKNPIPVVPATFDGFYEWLKNSKEVKEK